jgi:hypothetical protein
MTDILLFFMIYCLYLLVLRLFFYIFAPKNKKTAT